MFQLRKVSQDEGLHSEVINQFHTDSGLLLYDFVYPDIFKGCHPHEVPSLVHPRVIFLIKLRAFNSTTFHNPHEEEV